MTDLALTAAAALAPLAYGWLALQQIIRAGNDRAFANQLIVWLFVVNFLLIVWVATLTLG